MQLNSLHEMKALIPTHQFVTDFMDVLQLNNWFQGNSMTETDFRRLLEFIFYISLVNGEVKKTASYFSFKQGDTVADSAVLIREERGLPGTSPETQTSLVAPLIDDDQSQPCAVAMAKPGNVCSYCHKTCHIEKKYIYILRNKRTRNWQQINPTRRTKQKGVISLLDQNQVHRPT